MSVAELIHNHAALGDHLAYALGGASAGGYGSPERPGTTLSYAQLADVTRPWRQLAEKQLPGRRAVLQIADPLRFTVAFLGLIAGGATVVPIDPNAPEEHRRHLVDLLGGDVLVCDGAAADAVPVWSIDDGFAPPASPEPPSATPPTAAPSTHIPP